MVLLKHVSKAALIGVYYSLIYPHLTYTCTLWGNICNAPLSQIVKFQILKILPSLLANTFLLAVVTHFA